MCGRASVFHDAPRYDWKIIQDLLNAEQARAPGAFKHSMQLREFFRYIITPASNRWAFKPNGKTATTLALTGLFAVEFGCLPSTGIIDPTDQNANPLPHRLTGYDVFRFLLNRHDIKSLSDALQSTCYIATVRHPVTRCISSFRYLCASHDRSHVQFAADRTRMSALTGFNWSRDPNTVDGMMRFLDYIEISNEYSTSRLVDNHWRSQFDTIRPDLFPPDIVGRTENMREFFGELASRFNCPMPWLEELLAIRMNRGAETDVSELGDDTSVKRRVAEVYRKDFDAFGYHI